MTRYLQIWLASARYSIVRTMMFRFDFFLWALVELCWIDRKSTRLNSSH